MAGVQLVLLLALLACAGASSVLPAAQPGLLARTMGLLGWGPPKEPPASVPSPSGENASAVVERFQTRLRHSVAERLRAVGSVLLPTTGRQHRRAKRSLPDERAALDRDENGVAVLPKDNGVEKVWDFPATGAQHVHVFEDSGNTFALAAFGRGSKNSWLYELVRDRWTPISNFSSFGAVEFTSFKHASGRYIVGAEYDCMANRADKRGSILYLFRDRQLQYQHVLPGGYPTDVAIWNDYETFHIGVSSEQEKGSDGTVNYHVNSSIFKWTEGNFQQHTLPTYGARDLEHFNIQSHSFLAVANHRNNDGSLNLYSEILRYSLGSGQYRPYQRLPTHGAVRFRHFSWGQGVDAEHFLVVANQGETDASEEQTNFSVDSVIYKFSQSQFVPFQCVPTVRARDVLPLRGPSGEFALAVLDDVGLKLYQYTGWRFALVTLVRLPPPAGSGAADSRLSTFIHDERLHLTVGSVGGSQSRPAVYRLKFTYRRDLAELHGRCVKWCGELLTHLDQLQLSMEPLGARLRRAPRVDQPMTFTSLKIKSVQHTHFSNLTVHNVRLQENVALNSGLLQRLRSLRRRLQAGLASVASMHERLTGVISTAANHTFRQTVTLTGSWRLNTAAVDQVDLRQLNGVGDVTAFLTGLVWTDQPFTARAARLVFSGLTLQPTAHLTVDSLNHVRPDSFITLSGDHVITGSKVLVGHVTATDLTASLVNGVRITHNTVLVQGRLPAGVTQFGTVTATDLQVKYINGIDVQDVLQRAVPVSGGRLPAAVSFTGPVSVQSATIQSINGVSVGRLLQKAFTTSGGQNITGAWTVGSLHVDGELVLAGRLNGVRVPDDLVLVNRPELSYSLDGLAFSSVTVHQLTITERLGPVTVSNGTLQLLLTTGDQLVSGKKTIGSLHLTANSSVSGTVNGVNISTGMMDEALDQSATRIDGNKVIVGDVLFLSDVRLVGRLNGMDVSTLLRSALRLDDTTLPSMVFSDLQISGDLRASQLNGLSPSEWVMSSGTDQIITGNKALLSLSATSVTMDLLNGRQVDDFYSSVLRTEGDQHVQGPLVFTAETVFDTVVASSVDWEGHSLSEEAVTVRGSHVITGTKIYSEPLQVADLQVTDLWVEGLVDGVNLTSLLTRSAAAVNTSYMTVTGSQKFTSQVTASTLVVTGSVNSDELLDVLQDAVEDSLVRGDLTFDAPVTVQDLTFTGSFDGVPAGEFGSGWLTSAGGQTISGPLQLSGNATVTAPRLEVRLGGRLNGVLGGKLLDGRIPLAPGAEIRQNVTIKSLAAADVTVQMEGMNVSDAMRQNQSQIVLGAKTFAGGLYALGRVTVDGTVNGVDLGDLCRRAVIGDATSAIFRRLTVNGDVTLRGVSDPLSWTVNGVPLGRLESLFWLTDARQTLTGHVSLTGPYLAAVEDVQRLLSGTPAVSVDLDPYLRDYWSLSQPQTVTSSVTFLSDVTLTGLTADRLAVAGNLNGKDPSALFDSVLTVGGGSVTGEWILPDLLVTGDLTFTSLSGVPASALLRASDTEAHFTTRQTVRRLAVHGDVLLPEGGLVYLLDLSRDLDLAAPGRQPGGPLVVSSDVVFGSETVNFSQPLTVRGTVNGVRLVRSGLLTLDGQQRVPGVTRLTHIGGPCLLVPDLVTTTANGVSLDRLINHAIRVSGLAPQTAGPLVVAGHWTFIHAPSMLGNYAPSSETEQRTAQLLRQALWALERLRELDQTVAGEHLTVVRDIYRALREARAQLQAASYLQYYVALQRWSVDMVRLLPVFLDGEEAPPSFLAAISEDRVRLLHWRPAGTLGRWDDGPWYPERQVASMAGLRRSDGTAHVAEARLARPPTGVQVPDRVYRWDDPALRALGDAVNYIFLYHRNVLTQSQAMPSHKTVDVKSLKPSPAHDCFLFVHFSGNVSHLVCYSAAQHSFVVHQTIATLRARQAAVYSVSGSVCVAVAGGQRVDLWCWDVQRSRLVQRQTITVPAVGVTTAQFGGHTLLAITGADTGKVAGMVDLYSLEPFVGRFFHLQTVPVWAVRSARLLVLPSAELLLACLTADGRVVYLQYRGPSGFEPRGQLAVGHAASLELFNMDGLATQLTVAGRPPADMFRLTEHYPAAAFAGKFMGQQW